MKGEVAAALRKMDDGIKCAFMKVRGEMEEHLDSINQNTNEIHACYEYLADLEGKMSRLSERLDEVQYLLEPAAGAKLTRREQDVFMILYTAESRLSVAEIARRLGTPEKPVERLLVLLWQKGIPLLREHVGGEVYYLLDERFKELQARENVICVTEEQSRRLVRSGL